MKPTKGLILSSPPGRSRTERIIRSFARKFANEEGSRWPEAKPSRSRRSSDRPQGRRRGEQSCAGSLAFQYDIVARIAKPANDGGQEALMTVAIVIGRGSG